MIEWWWLIPTGLICTMIGIIATAVCAGSWDKAEEREKERKWAENNGLLYPENKKAADAGTSTAARETVRKDFFL